MMLTMARSIEDYTMREVLNETVDSRWKVFPEQYTLYT